METEGGTVALANSVSGYWLVRWKMYESGEGAKPYEGEFRKFTASLSHKTYEGVELDSLIVGVTTEIIGRDELLPKIDPNDETHPTYWGNILEPIVAAHYTKRTGLF